MIMKERSRVSLDIDGRETMQSRVLVSVDGEVQTVVSSLEGFPAYNTAILLLYAASDVLQGSGVGQPIMAAISMCKNQLAKIAEAEGDLRDVSHSEVPF